MILEAIYKIKWLFFLLPLPFLAWFTQAESRNDLSSPKPSSINLALRRTGDKLLRLSGDSLSRIPAVEQKGANVWQLRLEQPFNYDLLPSILDSAFQVYQIKLAYEVAVRNCSDSAIVLGFHHLDTGENVVPCGGRESENNCKFIEISLNNPTEAKASRPLWPYILYGFLSFAYLVWWLLKHKRKLDSKSVEAESITAGIDIEWLQFGNSRLDPARQVLEQNGQTQKLTYRESKLLAYLAMLPNQLVAREQILENVWADEGIQVSRSLDMFVSRLRKKLVADSSLRIVAVHGVGYRFEVDTPGGHS
jgi:hypothetical protein